MTDLKIQALEKKFTSMRKMPVLRPGYTVRVHQKIKEGEKERVQIFEGMVIALGTGQGSSKTVTVRKVVQGIGVEKIFPIYSPNVVKIEVKKTFGVRRAKLYYLRDMEGLSTSLKAKLGLQEKDTKMVQPTDEDIAEAAAAAKKAEEAEAAAAKLAETAATVEATSEEKAA
jgi:large subunit ribosomal protein L19